MYCFYRGYRHQERFWLKIVNTEGAKESRIVIIGEVRFADFSVDSFIENQYNTVSTLDLKEAKSVGAGYTNASSMGKREGSKNIRKPSVYRDFVVLQRKEKFNGMKNHQHTLYS